MKVDLERIAGETESYRVRMVESDDAGSRVVLGVVTRTSPHAWAFVPALKDTDTGEPVSLVVQADTADQLRDVLASRFGAIEIPANRVTADTMERFTDATFTNLNTLARETGSVSGYATALAGTLARLIVESVKPGQEDVFKSKFMARVDAHAEALRNMEQLRDAVADTLSGMFREMEESKDDDDADKPKPH